MSLKNISAAVKKYSKPDRAKAMQQFFKTGPGQYAHGDIFVGLTNPESRQIAKENKTLPFQELEKLITSKIHEQRFIALVILTQRFKKQSEKCYNFYLNYLDYVNNWDLIDLSSYKIVGAYLLSHREHLPILHKLATTDHLWRKRVAMISILAFIKNQQNQPTYNIAKLLLTEEHDLIHKAVGWMLRQSGKNDQKQLQEFLKENYDQIPRTCLRYAIEKFPEQKRQAFLKKKY